MSYTMQQEMWNVKSYRFPIKICVVYTSIQKCFSCEPIPLKGKHQVGRAYKRLLFQHCSPWPRMGTINKGRSNKLGYMYNMEYWAFTKNREKFIWFNLIFLKQLGPKVQIWLNICTKDMITFDVLMSLGGDGNHGPFIREGLTFFKKKKKITITTCVPYSTYGIYTLPSSRAAPFPKNTMKVAFSFM